MPEIKNNFLQGKMNKDLDERLIPNGQYRDALNVEISTAEGSSVGTVKNILGNHRIEDIIPSGQFKCVGSIADEKTNRIYWFISSYDKDAIIEYDVENEDVFSFNTCSPVLVDLNASNSNAVLKFTGSLITGVNIIDNLLFWTDNHGEPKKINIDECKKGTKSFDDHTQLIFDNGSFHGLTIKYLANIADANSEWTQPLQTKGRYFWFNSKQFEQLFPRPVPWGYDSQSDDPANNNYVDDFGVYGELKVRHYRGGEFLGVKRLMAWDGDNDFNIGNSNGTVYGSYARLTPHNEGSEDDFHTGDVLFAYGHTHTFAPTRGLGIPIDIQERHITVIKPKPLTAPAVKINHNTGLSSPNNIPNLFETKFPRFSYRYKYRDGEFSALAPFTNPIFNPKFPKNTTDLSDSNLLHNQDNIYDVKEAYNKAMVNSIHSIELTDFINAQTPEDAVEIDILYKQEDSPVVYSIGTITHVDPEWHDWSNNEGYTGLGKPVDPSGVYRAQWQARGGFTKGKYTVTTENIYAALPANQLLRPWDNVPRRALAQEVTGNRIVYGNYLQNYDLTSRPQIKVSYSDRINKIGSFDTQGLPSIKSQRNYQLGVVFCDKYGRETPVFTSGEGAINVPWSGNNGLKNASRSTQLNVSVASNFPEWVDSLKFFVKQNSSDYYNLIMDRAWVTKKTYALDNSEGHLWISFPSSDRNKIVEGDYITLKKKVEVGEKQVSSENKFKIIDIKNEAPDAIKYELLTYGLISNASNHLTLNVLQNSSNFRIDQEVDTIKVSRAGWTSSASANQSYHNIPLEEGNTSFSERKMMTEGLYMSWKRINDDGTSVSSKKYKIIGGRNGTTAYDLKLEKKISKIDADIAHHDGDSATVTSTTDSNGDTALHPNLHFHVEKKELKDDENFSGKFFVKISQNQITNLIETGEETSVLDNHIVSSKQSFWNWEDNKGTSLSLGDSNYGLTNWNGFVTGSAHGAHDVRNVANNNNVGQERPDGTTPQDAKVTDWYKPWDGVYEQHQREGQWFVDSMYMTAGQSQASDYAKYCCVTWSGCTKAEDGTPEDSAWSYPPLKKWHSEFTNSAELLENLSSFPATGGSELEDEGGDGVLSADNEVAVTGLSYAGAFDIDSVWYDNNLVSTSPIMPAATSTWNNLKMDGWIGPLQNVSRHEAEVGSGLNGSNHINGLEGIVSTSTLHSKGPRRWLSGITDNSTDHSAGTDTKTYSDDGETGKHFIHLSFFAPGVDLHDGEWDNLPGTISASDDLFGENAISRKLQGIWGGGHFTGDDAGDLFGDGSTKHLHVCMETNNNENTFEPLELAPAPGVGYGYDLDYREQHERQWDPTYPSDPDHKKRDFIRNLQPGSQFKWSHDPSGEPTVYTIKKVSIKKIYNHTSWRSAYNLWELSVGYFGSFHKEYDSVEQAAIKWLNTLDENGEGAGATEQLDFRNKIHNFGKASNRRICYIIEIDKDPTESSNFNPLDHSVSGTTDMTADVANNEFANIEFLEQTQSVLLSDLNKFPAIWETDPKKQDVDLDIYYEASNNIPVRLNDKTNEIFAPIGCKVEVLNAGVTTSCVLKYWEGLEVTLEPGFPRSNGVAEIDWAGVSFKFTREDGSFTIAEAGENELIGDQTGLKEKFIFRDDISDIIKTGLSWYNCFSFGNGLESSRIKDDFNTMFISNGVKASTTTQETYKEERRSHGLIYSGLYNSNSGINDLNQFIMAEKITKDLNPTYGSIQKLFQRRISLIAFCEDRVISITSNKDAIYNADGNPQLISSNLVLGDANPFVGDYGISRNPESFASESYRAYFTDKQRGAVLRLSKDGLTPISRAGMHDWFRDNLPKYTSLIGSYDSYKEDYNITLSNTYAENIIYNTYFQEGVESSTQSQTQSNKITNPQVYSGDNLTYPWETRPIDSHDAWMWKSGDPNYLNPLLESTVKVINHAAIPKGSLEGGLNANDASNINLTYEIDPATEYVQGVFDSATLPLVDQVFDTPSTGVNNYFDATNNTTSPNITWDNDTKFNIRRWKRVAWLSGSSLPYSSDTSADATSTWTTLNNLTFPNSGSKLVPQNIVRNQNNGNITFGRCSKWPYPQQSSNASDVETDHFIEIYGINDNASSGNTHEAYNTAVTNKVSGGGSHVIDKKSGSSYVSHTITSNDTSALPTTKEVLAGEELRVEVKIKVPKSMWLAFSYWNYPNHYYYANDIHWGINQIKPWISIYDGNSPISMEICVPESTVPPPAIISYGGNTWSWPEIGDAGITNPDGLPMGDPAQIWNVKDDTGTGGYNAWNDLYDNHFASNPVIPDNPYLIISSKPKASNGETQSSEDFSYWAPNGPDYGIGVTAYRQIKRYNDVYFCGFPKTVEPPYTQTGTGAATAGMGGSYTVTDPYVRSYPQGNHTYYTMVAHWKFKRNDLSGAFWSFEQTDTVVINDLRIRIGQNNQTPFDPTTGAAPQGWGSSGNMSGGGITAYNMFPYFDIEEIKVDRVFTQTNFASPYVPATTGQYQAAITVPPVPPFDVPAWTEIQHQGNTEVGGSPNSPITISSFNNVPAGSRPLNLQTHELALRGVGETWQFGDNYTPVTQTGHAVSNTPGQYHILGNPIEYKVPQDWGCDSTTPQDNASALTPNLVDADGNSPGTPFLHSYGAMSNPPPGATSNNTSSAVSTDGADYDRVTDDLLSPSTPSNLKIKPNPWVEIKTEAAGGTSPGQVWTYNLTNSGNILNTNDWYLVDVEFDLNYNQGSLAGTGPGHGEVMIIGVVNQSTPLNTVVDPNGVGRVRGGGNYGGTIKKHVELLPVDRVEYGSSRQVLRGIFQVHPNSYVNIWAGLGHLDIIFYDFTIAARVQNIVIKRINSIDALGEAGCWEHNTDITPHALSKRHFYYFDNKLCWDTKGDSNHTYYNQFFNKPIGGNYPIATQPTPETSPNGWTLKFTTSRNTKVGTHNLSPNGVASMQMTLSGLHTDGTWTGIKLNGFKHIGDYEMKFNFDGVIDSVKLDGADYTTANVSSVTGVGVAGNAYGDRLKFGSGNNSVPLIAAISNVSLTDETVVFTGGSIGSWVFDGFNVSTDNFITWADVDATSSVDGKIVFQNCPEFDPLSTVTHTQINVNQLIDKTINKGEKYKIEFEHNITSGKLHIYYFNSEGYGFRIFGTNPQWTSGSTFSTILEIGNAEWSINHPDNPNYTPELKESFVVRVASGSPNVNGSIDNITMTRVYDMQLTDGGWTDSSVEEKTVSFNENVNGWTSFKSFIPENGISLSKKYFTIKDGGLYQHYVPLKGGVSNGGWLPGETITSASGNLVQVKYTAEEAENYNRFYGQNYYHSSITAVLNTEPSVVKIFNTLNYEGDQARIKNPDNNSFITTNNAQAALINQDVDGWYCSNINTNLESGTVDEFIKKEGKWFNYIKGDSNSSLQLDTSRFSVQGLGFSQGFTII